MLLFGACGTTENYVKVRSNFSFAGAEEIHIAQFSDIDTTLITMSNMSSNTLPEFVNSDKKVNKTSKIVSKSIHTYSKTILGPSEEISNSKPTDTRPPKEEKKKRSLGDKILLGLLIAFTFFAVGYLIVSNIFP